MRITTAIATLALAALTACSTYARVAHTNAPGVVDLAAPPAHENGTDDYYEPPAYEQPGSQSYIGWITPSFGGGWLRHGSGMAVSVAVSVEKDRGGSMDVPVAKNAWGGTVGMDLVQFRSEQGQDAMVTNTAGPFWLEAYRRKFIVTMGAGPVVYPDSHDAGVQITVKVPLVSVRARWVQSSGFEAMFSYELPLPVVFGWSR